MIVGFFIKNSEMLSGNTFEKLFKALQILLPKMKRKGEFSFNSTSFKCIAASYKPALTVTEKLKSNTFFKKNEMELII